MTRKYVAHPGADSGGEQRTVGGDSPYLDPPTWRLDGETSAAGIPEPGERDLDGTELGARMTEVLLISNGADFPTSALCGSNHDLGGPSLLVDGHGAGCARQRVMRICIAKASVETWMNRGRAAVWRQRRPSGARRPGCRAQVSSIDPAVRTHDCHLQLQRRVERSMTRMRRDA
jgi:hypothetical protein